MAERLYRDAVQRGRMPEDMRIPLASLGQHAGGSLCPQSHTLSHWPFLQSTSAMGAAQRCQVHHWKQLCSVPLTWSSQAHASGEGVNCRTYNAGNVICNGCAGNAAHNMSIASAPAAPLPCLGLQDRLPAAPAQLPAQQPARRGPAQHRPVIGGIGKNIP